GSSAVDKRQNPQRTAAAVDDLERRGDQYRAGRRQLIKVAETRQAELAGAVHDRVIRKRRRECPGLAGIGADGLDADAEHVAILSEQLRGCGVEAWTVRPVGSDIQK